MKSNAQNSKRAAPGRPFEPGKSGNPGGRPKVAQEFKERCREFMEEQGWQLMVDMAKRGTGDDARFALKAAMEYAYGKPKEHKDVDMNVKGGVTILLPERKAE